MAIRAILVLGAIMLACGSAGLLLVRLTSPLLLGLGWMGGAFAAGAAGAGLLLNGSRVPPFTTVVLADTFILGSFVLLHVATLDLLECEFLVPVFGIALLALQIVADCSLLLRHGNGRTRAIVAGFLIGAQAFETITVLLPRAQQKLRPPALYVSLLLLLMVLVNFGRSAALMLGFWQDARSFYTVAAGTFALFLAVALGLGFGIFWMTTTVLTAGLEQAAATDPLTRTYNRRVFLRWCERELERYQRTGASFSILMIDFDHFKAINDTYGHHTGDEVLCSAVERMQDAIRGIDVLGRWGGEEFAALLPNASPEAATLVAERLRANVARMRLPQSPARDTGSNAPIQMTVSIGVATFAAGQDTIQQMLRRADSALYQAKSEGRNRVVVGPWIPQHTWVAATASSHAG